MAIAAIVFISIAGIAFIRFLMKYLEHRIEYVGADKAVLIICYVMIFVSLSTLPISLYLYTIGKKIRQAERFPPPGMTVIRDTPVITGTPAGKRGLILMMLAVVLLAVAAYLLAYAWVIFRTLQH